MGRYWLSVTDVSSCPAADFFEVIKVFEKDMLRLAELQKKKNQEIETKESRNKLFLIANICFAICMATSTICTTIIIIELLAK